MNARAVADIEEGVVLASVDIKAPRERVFKALTDGAEITQWWGSADQYKVHKWQGEPKIGGSWRTDGKGADGKEFSVYGEYLEFDPPKKVVFSWHAEWDAGNRTIVTYRLDEIEGGTRLTLTHKGFADRAEACNGHGNGWQRVLGWLADYLQPKPLQNYYVTRLLPPRPSFPFDMSADERAMMEAHSVYWRGLLQEGRVVVLGPVKDGIGAYGLGVVRAKDEADLEGVLGADPAITAGRGMRYESAPMMSALLPE